MIRYFVNQIRKGTRKGLTLMFLVFVAHQGFSQNIEEGKKLFEMHCTSCHSLNEKLIGPALKGVNQRREEAWLLKWIKNSQAVIKSGDQYAVNLFNEYNQSMMNNFEFLADGEIKNILAYIEKGEAEKAAEAPVVIADVNGSSGANGGSFSDPTFITLLVLLVVLIVVSYLLLKVRSSLTKLVKAKYPEDYETEPSYYESVMKPKMKKMNPTLVVLGCVVVVVLVGGIYGFKFGMNEVGVQKGYAPTQPINFSHEIHAGQYKIDCQYCHSTASKSKQASIPSASTCMNCHTHVQAKDKYNGKISPEIAKIYEAIDYNPETRQYGQNQKPIKWVRIHNLPDLAYFNHSQHVKVGKVACQTCHGQIQEMKVVGQHSTLQMGWCINCHRDSKVDVANNDYYEKLHADLKEKGQKHITVAKNGGLECSKCHY